MSNNLLSPFSAHLSRPPRQLGTPIRPPSPEAAAPPPRSTGSDTMGTDTESDGSSDQDSSSSDEDDSKSQNEDALNQFPMLDGPQRAQPSIVPPSGSSKKSAPPKRKKIPLEPGHSAMDWSKLKASGADLRGVTRLARYTPSEVALHNKRDDVWMAIAGKVYNVTHYLKFHPGGIGQVMRGAGKDATELYFKVHPWVNHDFILGEKCMVGYLIPESAKAQTPSSTSSSSYVKPTTSSLLSPSSFVSTATPNPLPASTSQSNAPKAPFQFAVPDVPPRVTAAVQQPADQEKDVFDASAMASSLDQSQTSSVSSLATLPGAFPK
ncbi:hypothetical protein HDU67_002305 [Dinochytrium kinnereticum]|nr:hypothetical protein HDU67_002305 [Dinochytrium kinnereticum]